MRILTYVARLRLPVCRYGGLALPDPAHRAEGERGGVKTAHAVNATAGRSYHMLSTKEPYSQDVLIRYDRLANKHAENRYKSLQAISAVSSHPYPRRAYSCVVLQDSPCRREFPVRVLHQWPLLGTSSGTNGESSGLTAHHSATGPVKTTVAP